MRQKQQRQQALPELDFIDKTFFCDNCGREYNYKEVFHVLLTEEWPVCKECNFDLRML